MELLISRKLDNWGHLFSIRRLRSAESKEGYIYDPVEHNYAECDEMFRTRMTVELSQRDAVRFTHDQVVRHRDGGS